MENNKNSYGNLINYSRETINDYLISKDSRFHKKIYSIFHGFTNIFKARDHVVY